MIDVIAARLKQGYRTMAYPAKPVIMPDRFRGLPEIDQDKCKANWASIKDLCPTDALKREGGVTSIDLGRCLFCGLCEKACSGEGIKFTGDYRLSTRTREDLVLSGKGIKLAAELKKETLRLFGRSLKLREVSAAGCNACEADTNVLNTLAFDLGRFGIQFVASPRHADGIFITGPVSKNMELALKKTYEAVPDPKIVIACGSCALSGGPYAGNAEVCGGAGDIVPIDLFIPGCPPHPMTILDGLLRLLKLVK